MRYFIDMDGTLCRWKPVCTEEELFQAGFFLNMEPNMPVVDAVQQLIRNGEDVSILSCYLEKSYYAIKEKNRWLDRHLPEIPLNKRIYVPMGKDKARYIPGRISFTDILLDDYTPNLRCWSIAGGIAVKLMNGVNGNKGTWSGLRVGMDKDAIIDCLAGWGQRSR